jgi:two-component system, cell cycle response regulator DivK
VPLMDSATRTAAQRSPGGSRSTNPHSRRSGTPERQPDCGDGRRERPPGRKCVLIVEDYPLNMKLFQALLETQSYRTIEATEGRAGLDLAREHDPDLIILDIELPDISGIDVIGALKSAERTRHIPIVVITASMPHAEPAIRAAGADAFMSKPIATAEFLATVRSFVEDDSGS